MKTKISTRSGKNKLLKDVEAGRATVNDHFVEPITGMVVTCNDTAFAFGINGIVPEMPIVEYEKKYGRIKHIEKNSQIQ